MAAFSSLILFPNKETATGLPPKFPPEPKIKLSTPYTLPTLLLIEFVMSGDVKSLASPGNKFTVNVAFALPGPTLFITFSTTS